MQAHPYFESVISRITGSLWTVIGWVIYSLLLYYYIGMEWWVACIDGLVAVGLLATAGFVYGFVAETIHSTQLLLLLGLLAQAISLLGAWEVGVWIGQEKLSEFSISLPLRLTLGISAWVTLLLWYQICRLKAICMENTIEPTETEQPTTTEENIPMTENVLLDRVTIKDGPHIHIIHLNELLYLQSSGDYVTLFTPTKQYVKEQTMKYFETHLPTASFVRIHRSCIVNMEQILRVELFGKENYQVRLKNGVSLRASMGGYKLLKERLKL